MGRKKEKKLLKNAFDICETIASFASVIVAKNNNKNAVFFSSDVMEYLYYFILYTNTWETRYNPRIGCLR